MRLFNIQLFSLLIGIVLLYTKRTNAQQQSFCQTESNIVDFLSTIPAGAKIASHGSYTIRIFVHVIRKTDGTGGQTLLEVNTALNILVGDYEQHNICLSLLGIDEINNDTHYNQTSFTNDNDGDGKFDNFSPNSHSNAIDIYLFANDKLNFGKASAIPGAALVIGGNAFGSNLGNYPCPIS